MNKKADTNWVLISMVLAILVLAVVGYIFWTKATSSSDQASGIAACKARGGDCFPEGTCDSGTLNAGRMNCLENQDCCIPLSI